MKSQDILLLLKLVALERQTHVPAAIHGELREDRIGWLTASPADSTLRGELESARQSRLSPDSVRGLAAATGISKSEVSKALARCYANGLAKPQGYDGPPVVNRRGLEEFLSYGIRFVFPAQMLGLARGVPTGLTAPIFEGVLRSAGDHVPVWPDPHGDTLGLAVEPLYKTVTVAIREDETLHRLLATVDSIRLGQPRERKLAITQLHALLDF